MLQLHTPSATDPPLSPGRTRPPPLARGQLHEVHAAADGWAAALAFGLARVEADARSPIVLLRVRPDGARRKLRMEPCGEGWAPLGLDPARLLIVDARDEAGLLRAGLDAARENGAGAGIGAVLMESWGPLRAYDLVASRRLILAAESARLPIVILRGDAQPRASAAHTRWHVASAPSTPLAMRAPGLPALLVELQRRRGGPAGLRWRLEWNEDDGGFREELLDAPDSDPEVADHAPLSGAVVSLAAVRTRAPLRRSA